MYQPEIIRNTLSISNYDIIITLNNGQLLLLIVNTFNNNLYFFELKNNEIVDIIKNHKIIQDTTLFHNFMLDCFDKKNGVYDFQINYLENETLSIKLKLNNVLEENIFCFSSNFFKKNYIHQLEMFNNIRKSYKLLENQTYILNENNNSLKIKCKEYTDNIIKLEKTINKDKQEFNKINNEYKDSLLLIEKENISLLEKNKLLFEKIKYYENTNIDNPKKDNYVENNNINNKKNNSVENNNYKNNNQENIKKTKNYNNNIKINYKNNNNENLVKNKEANYSQQKSESNLNLEQKIQFYISNNNILELNNLNQINDLKKNNWIFTYAVENNNITILEYLKNNKFDVEENIFRIAIKKCNINTLEWLKNNGFKFGEQVLKLAVEYRTIEIVQWLLENNCNMNSYVFSKAVLVENLEILKLLHKYNCEKNEYAFFNAVQKGNIEIMEWLKSINCELGKDSKIGCWNKKIYDLAREPNNSIDIILWLRNN